MRSVTSGATGGEGAAQDWSALRTRTYVFARRELTAAVAESLSAPEAAGAHPLVVTLVKAGVRDVAGWLLVALFAVDRLERLPDVAVTGTSRLQRAVRRRTREVIIQETLETLTVTFAELAAATELILERNDATCLWVRQASAALAQGGDYPREREVLAALATELVFVRNSADNLYAAAEEVNEFFDVRPDFAELGPSVRAVLAALQQSFLSVGIAGEELASQLAR
jgi:hypothetical protein